MKGSVDASEAVRFEMFADSPETQPPAAVSLTKSGGKGYAGTGWIVAAGNRHVKLDMLVRALT